MLTEFGIECNGDINPENWGAAKSATTWGQTVSRTNSEGAREEANPPPSGLGGMDAYAGRRPD